MNDPYKILGVPPTATDEEVKKAYHALARKYHPDKYRDSDLAELAGEKMKEVNEAYDRITAMRKNQGNGHTYQGPRTDTSDNGSLFSQVRFAINRGDVVTAEQLLMSVEQTSRQAEWHFLMGAVMTRKGFFTDALHYLDTACAMDPYNTEYRAARDQLHNRARSHSPYDSSNGSFCCTPCGGCDLCSTLLCANCCCSCLGGDVACC